MTGTPSRSHLIDTFLRDAGWGDARRHQLRGDASRRSYTRLSRTDVRAMLMDAPPEAGEDVRPFLALARHLSAHGFSTPKILAEDSAAGLLLIEDFGDDLFATLANADADVEARIYAAAGHALGALHEVPVPTGLPAYTPQMGDLAGLALDWYAPEAAHLRPALVAAINAVLPRAEHPGPVLVHRDFHAENLIWLPEREGRAAVGLLDFQDAMSGPPDYDIASLIDDPRRVVTSRARDAALVAYLDRSGRDASDMTAGVAICTAQRSLRILGVFARLCMRDGKAHYPDFIPRTWLALQGALDHDALTDLRAIIAQLPAPDAQRLAAIRAHAGTCAGRTCAEPYL